MVRPPETAWPIKAKLCRASIDRGNESLLAASGSLDQDGHHAQLCGKNPSKIFSVIVSSNDDPGLTLTNFTTRSNLVTY